MFHYEEETMTSYLKILTGVFQAPILSPIQAFKKANTADKVTLAIGGAMLALGAIGAGVLAIGAAALPMAVTAAFIGAIALGVFAGYAVYQWACEDIKNKQ